jgi:hypothetical protein
MLSFEINEIPSIEIIQTIDMNFYGAATLLGCIDDEAGLRLFLDIEDHVAACWREMGLQPDMTDGASRKSSLVDHMYYKVMCTLAALRFHLESDPEQGRALLEELAEKTNDIQSSLYHLRNWEMSDKEELTLN